MDVLPKRGAKAERTLAAILEAAEVVFAEKGFAAARLSDIADAVGIRRGSINYYFRDKRELYEEVQKRLFAGLRDRLLGAIEKGADCQERIENMVTAWVHYACERPAVAYMIMGEIVESPHAPSEAIGEYIAPVLTRLRETVEEGQAQGVFRSLDPVHLIFNLAGSTVFYVAAVPSMAPEWSFDPLTGEHQETHLFTSLSITRRLLGLS